MTEKNQSNQNIGKKEEKRQFFAIQNDTITNETQG